MSEQKLPWNSRSLTEILQGNANMYKVLNNSQYYTSNFESNFPSVKESLKEITVPDYIRQGLFDLAPNVLFFTNPSGSWGRNRRLMISFDKIGYLINNNATISSSDPSFCIENNLQHCEENPRSYKQITINQAIRLLNRDVPEMIKLLFKSLGIVIPDKAANYSEEDKKKIIELLQSKKAINPDAAFTVDESLRELCYNLVDNGILKIPSWDDTSFYIDTEENLT